jgi:hypothetical protein
MAHPAEIEPIARRAIFGDRANRSRQNYNEIWFERVITPHDRPATGATAPENANER